RSDRKRLGSGIDRSKASPHNMSSSDPREGTHHQVEGVTYFALVGSQRCGTNFFRELMNTNQQTVVHGEILMPYPLPNCWHNYVRTMVNRAMPPIYAKDCVDLVDDYLVFLREDVKRGYPGKLGVLSAVGLDIKYNQLRFIAPLIRDLEQKPFLIDYFWRRNMPIVHMMRRNTIHQALSLVIAAARNVYHNYGGKKFDGKVKLDPEAVISHAAWVAKDREVFRTLAGGMKYLEVCYEDVAEDCKSADESGRIREDSLILSKVADFLNVPNEFYAPSTISKVINRPYSEIIENYQEVVAAVRKSEFKKLADSI
ncbi:MAG: hypothetical protein ACI85K_002548, partial [Hyphomicrobiaceae bacterium]